MTKICVSLMVERAHCVLETMARARDMGADLLEWRLDVTPDPDVEGTLRHAPLPVIATVRSVQQGGCFRGTRAEQLRLLVQAGKGGSAYLDWEFCRDEALPPELSRMRARVIVSYHNVRETPADGELKSLFAHMAATGAGVVKVVTRARKPEDNISVLNLIELGRRKGQRAVAFCLGPLGRVSRIACPLVGGAFTFAALEGGAEAAPGQLTVAEMRQLLHVLT